MTVREYLSQASLLGRMINAKKSRIENLREKQYFLGGGVFDVKVQTSIAQDFVGDATADVLDLIDECQRDILRLLSIQRDIEETIETLERTDLRLILFERYVNLKCWEDIAADNNYSWNTVHTKHRTAIAALEKSEWNRTPPM